MASLSSPNDLLLLPPSEALFPLGGGAVVLAVPVAGLPAARKVRTDVVTKPPGIILRLPQADSPPSSSSSSTWEIEDGERPDDDTASDVTVANEPKTMQEAAVIVQANVRGHRARAKVRAFRMFVEDFRAKKQAEKKAEAATRAKRAAQAKRAVRARAKGRVAAKRSAAFAARLERALAVARAAAVAGRLVRAAAARSVRFEGLPERVPIRANRRRTTSHVFLFGASIFYSAGREDLPEVEADLFARREHARGINAFVMRMNRLGAADGDAVTSPDFLASKTQAAWKARARHEKSRAAAAVVQAVVRGHLARERKNRLGAADAVTSSALLASKIQAALRGRKVRARHEKSQAAAAVVQAVVRGHLVRSEVVRLVLQARKARSEATATLRRSARVKARRTASASSHRRSERLAAKRRLAAAATTKEEECSDRISTADPDGAFAEFEFEWRKPS